MWPITSLTEPTNWAACPRKPRPDYTLVLVRKTTGAQTQNLFVVKAVWLRPGGGLARANHLSAIADLNGDGVMELVVYNAYYEGSDSDVLQVKGGKVTHLLGCSCEH